MKSIKEMKQIILTALNDKDQKEVMVKQLIKDIGYFDKANRFNLFEVFQTESSSQIRTPSRNFPFSVYKHIFTTKYLKQLLIVLDTPIKD